MAKFRKTLPEESIDTESYRFNDDATKNKIKKHIHDIKDVITEEDIANAKVPGEEDNLPEPSQEEEKKKASLPKVNPSHHGISLTKAC